MCGEGREERFSQHYYTLTITTSYLTLPYHTFYTDWATTLRYLTLCFAMVISVIILMVLRTLGTSPYLSYLTLDSRPQGNLRSFKTLVQLQSITLIS